MLRRAIVASKQTTASIINVYWPTGEEGGRAGETKTGRAAQGATSQAIRRTERAAATDCRDREEPVTGHAEQHGCVV